MTKKVSREKITRCKHCLRRATEKCDICDGPICEEHANDFGLNVIRCDACQAKLEAEQKEEFAEPGSMYSF